jgi:mRNA interferase RelE/StbE|nr:MAG TPA: Cytotoxic translational repressor [Caudoviricetes sp.]
MYKVRFSKSALKALRKLDKFTRTMLINWLEKHLDGCENPRVFGKALTANHKGKWRYRVGDYRIICKIDDGEIVILVLEIGHRRDIYI